VALPKLFKLVGFTFPKSCHFCAIYSEKEGMRLNCGKSKSAVVQPNDKRTLFCFSRLQITLQD